MAMSNRPDDPGTARSAALAEDLRLVFGKMKRRLREQTDLGGFSWSQMSVISYLDREGPATVTTLARIEGMRPQYAGRESSASPATGLAKRHAAEQAALIAAALGHNNPAGAAVAAE